MASSLRCALCGQFSAGRRTCRRQTAPGLRGGGVTTRAPNGGGTKAGFRLTSTSTPHIDLDPALALRSIRTRTAEQHEARKTGGSLLFRVGSRSGVCACAVGEIARSGQGAVRWARLPACRLRARRLVGSVGLSGRGPRDTTWGAGCVMLYTRAVGLRSPSPAIPSIGAAGFAAQQILETSDFSVFYHEFSVFHAEFLIFRGNLRCEFLNLCSEIRVSVLANSVATI